jgi:uncharacterized protein (TIGR04222 family)
MVVWGDPYLVTLGVLLVVSILLRVAGVARRVSVDADPALCACLRGNALAVVVTTLAMLHERERVAAGLGRVHRTGPLSGENDPMQRAVYSALHKPMSPRELVPRPPVRRALAELRRTAAAAGLLLPKWRWVTLRLALCLVPVVGVARLFSSRLTPVTLVVVIASVCVALGLWLLSRRTRAGGRMLAALRRSPSPDIGMAVALNGADALRSAMPILARDGGLLSGGRGPDDSGGDGTIRMNDGVYGGPGTP